MGVTFFMFGQTPESFYDIISESLTVYKTNKSIELKAFWIMAIIGIILLLLLFIYNKRFPKKEDEDDNIPLVKGVTASLIISIIVYFILSGNLSFPLICILFLIIISNIMIPKKEFKLLVTSCFLYYSIYATLILINVYITKITISNNLIFLFTTLISILIINLEKKYNILNKSILLFQTIIPTLLTVYLVNRYSYHNETMYLDIPIVARIFFISLILILQIYTLYFICKKYKTNEKDLNKLISISTIIAICIFNFVADNNTSLILPNDLHHVGENILSFQQIFSFNQIPYLEYIPVSGLFSVFSGFILELIGGKLMYYGISLVIINIIFATTIILLLNKHLNKSETLLFSILFILPNYNRIYLILISILILMLPKLIENRNLWLKVWLYSCFIGGLYYPIYGVAVLVGTLPFALVQLVNYIKSTKFKKDIKKVSFYIWWAVALIPIILSIPLLFNMAKHILVYSKQSTLADGISVFGQYPLENILNIFEGHAFIKRIIFYCLRYVMPALGIWTFLIILLSEFQEKLTINKIKEKISSPKFLAITSGLSVLIVSYSYTLVRADVNRLLSRTGKLMCIICGMLLLVIFVKYLKKNISNFIIMGIFIGLIMALDFSPLTSQTNKMIHDYVVPESYKLIKNSKLPRLGNGFASPEELNSFVNEKFSIKKMENMYDKSQELLSYDKNLKFTLYGCLGTYYIMDLPTVGQPSVHAIKSKKTSDELIEIIKKYKPVVGKNIADNVQTYYLYHWLMTTDEYLYSKKYKAFLPRELYKKIFSNEQGDNKIEAKLTKKDFTTPAVSFGKSFKTLKNIFDEQDIKYDYSCKYTSNNKYVCDYKLNKKIKGIDSDFIYLKIDTNRDNYDERNLMNTMDIDFTNADILVSISDDNKQYAKSNLYNGQLLIPIGANNDWLLNEHDNFKITIKGIESKYKLKINQIKFLKLDVNRKG